MKIPLGGSSLTGAPVYEEKRRLAGREEKCSSDGRGSDSMRGPVEVKSKTKGGMSSSGEKEGGRLLEEKNIALILIKNSPQKKDRVKKQEKAK